MKKFIIALLLAAPVLLQAQTTLTPQEQLEQAQRQLEAAQAALEQAKANAAKAQTDAATPAPATQGWTQPALEAAPKAQVEKKNAKEELNAPYLAEDAVPMVDGQVQWTTTLEADGLTAQQIYDKLLTAINTLTQGEDELEGSKVALVNVEQHSILATMREYLTFTKSFLSLDRTECTYALQAECQDGRATITMSHIRYAYTTQNKTERYTAEQWITDKMAVNKKHTKLYRGTGKFRRGTIDRKDAVFKYLNDAIKLL